MLAFAQPTFFLWTKSYGSYVHQILAICRGHRGLVRGRILGKNIEGIFRGREGKIFFGPSYLPFD